MAINGKKFAKEWMGRVVKATHEVRNHETRELRTPVVGWVVGYTYRRRGSAHYEPDVGRVFESKGPGTPVALVCPWPGRRAIDVPFDAIELTDEQPAPPDWSSKDRDQMRFLMRNEPRGPDGRWLPVEQKSVW